MSFSSICFSVLKNRNYSKMNTIAVDLTHTNLFNLALNINNVYKSLLDMVL